ncbi:hypothetical protein V2J09_010761 [Rumex salicifolius]
MSRFNNTSIHPEAYTQHQEAAYLVPDISRMYRFFSKNPRGLKLVAALFKQVLVRKVIKLHDKYMTYVNDYFMNHTLFHKALKEAFEVFCNKGVAGSSSAELLATFCDNILKKGGSEKLSDEAIEETFDKVNLVECIDRKKLACHLLFDKSANDDHERSILTKLKQQCGARSSCFLVIGHASLEQQMNEKELMNE